MTSPPHAPPIDADLPCAICDYNLKGLSPDAACPECGQPITRTYTFDLAHADPSWLRRQARTLPFLGALFMLNFQYSGRWGSSGFVVAAHLAQALYVVAAIVAAAACIRLTAPDPKRPADDDTLRRGLQLASLLLVVTTILDTTWLRRADVLPGSLSVSVAAFGRTISLIATQLLALILVARLAKRSRDRSLRRHATVACFLLPAVPFIDHAPSVLDLRPLIDLYVLFRTLYDWAVPVALYATLILLGRTVETLRTAAAKAGAAAATPPPVTAS